MKKLVTIACAALLLASLGCKMKEKMDKAAIAADLNNKGTMDLIKETSKDQYTAPADKRLTEAQIQMYLKVREHERDIAKVARENLKKQADQVKKDGEHSISGMADSFKALGSVADLMTADIRAAKDLGYNTAEYQWVKGQVIAASMADMTSQIVQTSQQSMDAAYAQTKKQYDEAKDEQTKKMLGEVLAGYDKSKQELASQQNAADPSLEYNRKLLAKYDGALNAIKMEMSKYEEKEGDAQKSMQEFQQSLDKAKADAQKAQSGQ